MNTDKKTRKPRMTREEKEKAKCKKVRCDDLPQKERLEALNDVIDHLKHVKNLNGFIVLVDETEETPDGKHRKGLNACCGPCDILCNLIANIDPDLLKEYENKKRTHSLMTDLMNGKGFSSISEIDKALREVFKMMNND